MPSRPLRLRAALLGTLAVVLLGGCRTIRRTLTIESDPPGATVWIDGVAQPRTTPVTVDFTWYGWWEVRLEKEGYQSLAADVHVPTRVDGYPVIDLPLERLGPDVHVRRRFRLEPLPPAPQEEDLQAVLERAQALKSRAQSAAAAPPAGPTGRTGGR